MQLIWQVVMYPLGENGDPVMEPQYKKPGMSGFMMGMSAFREQIDKLFAYPAIIILLLTILISLACYMNRKDNFVRMNTKYLFILYGLLAAGVALVFLKPDVNSYVLPDRLTLDSNHFIISIFALVAGAYTWIRMKKENHSGTQLIEFQAFSLILAFISGIFMMIKFDLIYQIARVAYTVFDISIVLSVLIIIVYFINDQFSILKVETQK
jgi:hypothetical protein